ncbi:hypothetical protein ACIRP7_43610 [Streptomyces sp. NPDC102270]|uniref:hypothetical protein n=1 Tax=Streptomyces sp. NPDC102270 TaxID=3366150 RepID=UPI00380A9501
MQTPTSTREATSPTPVPPGLVIPLAAALPVWRTNGWTSGPALGVCLFVGEGVILTPDTGDRLSAACLAPKGART